MTVLCALSMAVTIIAVVLAFIPHLAKVAVVVSLPAFVIGIVATTLALVRNTRLVLPAITLLLAALPASKENWREFRTVWVESAELCNPPAVGGGLVGLVVGMAVAADYRDAVGANVCGQLGRSYTDHDCDGRIGRIKCEP